MGFIVAVVIEKSGETVAGYIIKVKGNAFAGEGLVHLFRIEIIDALIYKLLGHGVAFMVGMRGSDGIEVVENRLFGALCNTIRNSGLLRAALGQRPHCYEYNYRYRDETKEEREEAAEAARIFFLCLFLFFFHGCRFECV